MTAVPHEATQALESTMGGHLARWGDAEDEGPRSVWSAMIDTGRGTITRCCGVADVIHATPLAQGEGLFSIIFSGGCPKTQASSSFNRFLAVSLIRALWINSP